MYQVRLQVDKPKERTGLAIPKDALNATNWIGMMARVIFQERKVDTGIN